MGHPGPSKNYRVTRFMITRRFFFPKAEPLGLRIFPEGVATHPYWSDLVIENEKSKINKLVSIVFINLFMIIILLIPMKDEKKFSHNFFID